MSLDRDILTLLRYYTQVCHPNVWKTEHCLKPSSSQDYLYQWTSQSIISDCLEHEVNMYAIASSMASQSVFLHHIKLERSTSYYYDKALTTAQESVAQAVCFSDRMIFNAFHLACAEFYRYHSDEAFIHLQTIGRAVKSRGGLSTLSAPLRELLILGDGYAAAEIDKVPVLGTWDVEQIHVVPSELVQHYSLRAESINRGSTPAASGFCSDAAVQLIPPDLRRNIRDLAVCIELLKQFSDNCVDRNEYNVALHWIHVQILLIRHRLLQTRYAKLRVDVIRIALIAWGLLVLSGAGRVRIVKTMAKSARAKLLLISDDEWTGLDKVRCWILLVLAQCAERGSAARDWYVSELRRLRAFVVPGVPGDNWESAAMLGFCQDFFVLDRVEEAMLIELTSQLNSQPV